MSYKPLFCCQCGDKIDRIEWKIYTSRRFCQLCEIEFKMQDWIPAIVLTCGAFFWVLTFGTYWQKPENGADKNTKEIVEVTRKAELVSVNGNVAEQNATNKAVRNFEQSPTNSLNVENRQTVAAKNDLKKPQNTAVLEVPEETLYFCGAQTKKGFPCSHKVKGGGRCWQHQGKTSMLPQGKLLVSRQEK